MPVISISLSVDFLWEIEKRIKKMQEENPNANISRNMVVRHYIDRGIEYSNLLQKAKEVGGVLKIERDNGMVEE